MIAYLRTAQIPATPDRMWNKKQFGYINKDNEKSQPPFYPANSKTMQFNTILINKGRSQNTICLSGHIFEVDPIDQY